MKYDSLLYGNGLTLKLLDQIKEEVKRSSNKSKLENYVDMTSYISYFAQLQSHNREIRNFRQTFSGFKFCVDNNRYIDEMGNLFTKHQSDTLWTSALNLISKYKDSINKYGAERWLSSVLFEKEFDNEIRPYKDVLYSLYCYWYMQLKREILSLPNCKFLCEQSAQKVDVYKFGKIFTTNFDTLLDVWLNPQHLHGKFIDYLNFQELSIFEFKESPKGEKRHEYPYLYGTNGIEKLNRLFRINQKDAAKAFYNTDFFFCDDLHLGNLLIYGISFGSTPFMNDFIKNPQYTDDYEITCVDGHILLRLSTLKKLGRINSITVTYHSSSDKTNYEQLFKSADLSDILTLASSHEIAF